jgi:hypothetical protein
MMHLNNKIKNRCLLLSIFLTPLLLFSQAGIFIKKSYAYYSIAPKNLSPKGGGVDEIIPIGADSMISLPETTVEKDTSLLVFVETTTKNIKWGIAQQGHFLFSVTQVLVKGPLQPGFVNGAGQINISAAKGRFIFSLQLIKKQQKTIKDKWILTVPIVLKGTCAGKNILFKTVPLKEIIAIAPS